MYSLCQCQIAGWLVDTEL